MGTPPELHGQTDHPAFSEALIFSCCVVALHTNLLIGD